MAVMSFHASAGDLNEPRLSNGQAKYFNLPSEIIETLNQRYNSQNSGQGTNDSAVILSEIIKGLDQNKIKDLAFPSLSDGSFDGREFIARIPELIQSASQNLSQDQINQIRNPQFLETIKSQLIQGVTRALEERGFSIDPETGKLALSFNGMQIKGFKFSLSADGKYIIIDNFRLVKGDSVLTADRVMIEKSQIRSGQPRSLDAVNLKVQSGNESINFGWAKLSAERNSQSKISSISIVSSQLNVNENGQAKFATKKGPTSLEAIHTTIEFLPSKGVRLSLQSEVGFTYNRNSSNPQSDLRIDSMGGSLTSVETNLNSQNPNVVYKFQTSSDLKVFDPNRKQNLLLSGNSSLNAIENRSAITNQVASVDYVIASDQFQIDRYAKNEKIVAQGLFAQIQENKAEGFTQGNVTADYVTRSLTDRTYEASNVTYSFRKDSTSKVESLQADKAIYVSDKDSIVVEGRVEGRQSTNLQTGEKSSYLAGDKVTFFQDNKWNSTFSQFEMTTQKFGDKSEKMFVSVGSGVVTSSSDKVQFNGRTQFIKETSVADSTTKYSLVNSETMSGEQNKDGSKRLFSLSQADIQTMEASASGSKVTQFSLKGSDLYFEDQARAQAISAKNISVLSNKSTDVQGETKEAYAVELGEALLKDLSNGKNDYVLISSTVIYERSSINKAQNGSILVKDLTGEIDGYKLTFRINKPEDSLAGKTVDVYFNKNKEMEYYSIKNEHGIIAAEKDGKKIIWTGGSIDVYKDGKIRISNITGTEMAVSDDKISGQIKIGQAVSIEQGSSKSIQAKNVVVDGKSKDGEMGTIQFGDLEILKDSGVQNLTASKFSAMLSRLDSKNNQSVSITADGVEAAKTDGVSKGIVIKNGDLAGADSIKGQKLNLSFSQFNGSENIADKSKGLSIEQARINFSEDSAAKKITGDMTIGKNC